MTGNIAVSTMTTGASFDPNGYTVTVDLVSSRSIPANGSTTFSVLTGAHTVALGGVASNCTVSGPSTRVVTVLLGGTVSANFTVSCAPTGPTTGNLTVSAATSGPSPDPDGYVVTVDGSNGRGIPINGSTTYSGIPPGNHVVALNGLAGNCTVSGPNPRPVPVTAGNTASTTFFVSCAPTGPTTGSLAVSATTTGSGLDPDGYMLTLDGSTNRALPTNGGSTLFTGLAPGGHAVTLSGVAGNCSVIGGPSRIVSVTAGSTATTSFSVSCAATTPPPPPPPPPPPSGGARITGVGAIGGGSQTFDFDATDAPGGRMRFTDVSLGATVTVDPGDPGTRITSFTRTSSACVTFGGTGRLDTNGLPVDFSIDACDNGSPGVGRDVFTMSVPSRTYRASGTLTSGDITASGGGGGAPPPPPTGIRVIGHGSIGTGPATPGSDRLDFDFDVTSAPGGRLFATDYSVVRRSGSAGTMIADRAADPTTAITSLTRTSATCVRIGGMGHLDTDEHFQFFIDVCDNASPGAGSDTFTVTIPNRGGPGHDFTHSGTVSAGDIAIISSTS